MLNLSSLESLANQNKYAAIYSLFPYAAVESSGFQPGFVEGLKTLPWVPEPRARRRDSISTLILPSLRFRPFLLSRAQGSPYQKDHLHQLLSLVYLTF